MPRVGNIRIWSYGKYSSDNYGANTLAVKIGDITIYFSYETPVAFRTPEDGLVVSQNVWSNTTGKHLNFIDNGIKDTRVPYSIFVEKLNEALKKRGLGEYEGE